MISNWVQIDSLWVGTILTLFVKTFPNATNYSSNSAMTLATRSCWLSVKASPLGK